MCSTSEMLARFKAISLPEIVRDIAIDTHTELEDLNKKQLYAGKRPDGTDITPSYTPLTQFLKQQKGQPWDRVTLMDQGDFYREIELRVDANTFDLQSTDSKARELEAKYGDVMGLSVGSKDEYRQNTLKPRVKAEIQDKTGTGK